MAGEYERPEIKRLGIKDRFNSDLVWHGEVDQQPVELQRAQGYKRAGILVVFDESDSPRVSVVVKIPRNAGMERLSIESIAKIKKRAISELDAPLIRVFAARK